MPKNLYLKNVVNYFARLVAPELIYGKFPLRNIICRDYYKNQWLAENIEGLS